MATTEVVDVVAMAMITVMVAGVATMKSGVDTLMAKQMSINPLQAVGVAGEEEWSRMNTTMANQMSIALLQAVGVAGEDGWSRMNTSTNLMNTLLQAVVVAWEEGEGHGAPEAAGVARC